MTAVASVEVFAHMAPSLHFDEQTLTLVDLSPSTIRSRPQPSRVLGVPLAMAYAQTAALSVVAGLCELLLPLSTFATPTRPVPCGREPSRRSSWQLPLSDPVHGILHGGVDVLRTDGGSIQESGGQRIGYSSSSADEDNMTLASA